MLLAFCESHFSPLAVNATFYFAVVKDLATEQVFFHAAFLDTEEFLTFEFTARSMCEKTLQHKGVGSAVPLWRHCEPGHRIVFIHLEMCK